MPAITELVFVHASSNAIQEYKQHSKETIYWLTKPNGNRREKIVVPEKAMEDFIRVTEQAERSVTYFQPNEVILNKGDRILIHGGPFDGIEGILLKMKGKREKQIIVYIPDIIAAAISIKPKMIELISQQKAKSINPSEDTKELIRLTTQLLLSSPERIEQATEYDIIYWEIRRIYDSLLQLRGFLPTYEGEMSLALLMAEKSMRTIKEETKQRFLKAISKQGERSLLKVKMQYIGGKILNNNELMKQSEITISRWKLNTLSNRQLQTIAEIEKWAHF